MAVSALEVKKWCDKNLSPVAWQRVVVKVSPEFRGTGLTIANLTDPSESIMLQDDQYEIVKRTIESTYDVSVGMLT